MKISNLIIIILIILAVVGGIALFNNSNKEENIADNNNQNIVDNSSNEETKGVEVNSVEELSALIDKIYEGNENLYPSLATQELDVTDENVVNRFTGLDNGEDLEFLVVSEPMMSSQAYSLVLAKVKDGVDVENVAKTMNENIDARKWICVAAEKVYTTSSNNVVFLLMTNEEMAKPIYENIKTVAGKIGQEYERAGEEFETDGEDVNGVSLVVEEN